MFLAECYAPGFTRDRFNRDSDAIRRAAAQMTAAGRFVQCRCSVHVPSDDLALYIIDATSPTHIEQLGDSAAVTFDRILACSTRPPANDPDPHDREGSPDDKQDTHPELMRERAESACAPARRPSRD